MAYVLEYMEYHWENLEMSVGKDGISLEIHGKPLENLVMPGGKICHKFGNTWKTTEKAGNARWKDGISLGMEGIPLENLGKTFGKSGN